MMYPCIVCSIRKVNTNSVSMTSLSDVILGSAVTTLISCLRITFWTLYSSRLPQNLSSYDLNLLESEFQVYAELAKIDLSNRAFWERSAEHQ